VRFVHLGGVAALGFEIGRKGVLLIFNPDERGCEFRGFPVLRDDQRDRWPLNLTLSS
jgi:hypothetical protein